MQWVYGCYETAIIHTDDVEKNAIQQVKDMCDHITAQNAHIRIMPDVHAGFGCVVGYTAKTTQYLIPSLIGIDIGCGVCSTRIPYCVENKDDFFRGLDNSIRQHVPSGFGKHTTKAYDFNSIQSYFAKTSLAKEMRYVHFHNALQAMQKKFERSLIIEKSIGTLGGGNHFIEVDEDTSNNDLWLTIHTGSRVLGYMVAMYYKLKCQVFEYDIPNLCCRIQKGEMIEMEESVYPDLEEYANQSLKDSWKPKKIQQMLKHQVKTFRRKSDLSFLSGKRKDEYIKDMQIAQAYAGISRQCITDIIMMYINQYAEQHKLDSLQPSHFAEYVESVHNYIDFTSDIIRKGAISAQLGEKVVIPLNMRDGVILGVGKGNEEWNFSAPHGSGRKMSRTDAKYGLDLEVYKKQMSAVWSTSVGKDTLDEAPDAYKSSDVVKQYLQESVDIVVHLKSVYNFKAGNLEEEINPFLLETTETEQ